MNTPTLETPRLRLRPIREGDAEDIFACWMHDEEVSRYMEWSASDDIADAREFVRFELSKLKLRRTEPLPPDSASFRCF